MKNFFFYIYHLYYRHKNFFPKKTYSCWGEDIIISNFFKNKKKGFYIDVGSYHPFFWNNTYLLYKKDWSGINVDANSLSTELFNFARPKDNNFNFAVTNKKLKKIKLFFRRKINVLNTTNKKFAKINFPNGYQTSTIKCTSLNNLISKTKFKNKLIDFLNIDVEGNEIEVLKSLNFKIYQPSVICIEIHHNDTFSLKQNPVFKFLIKKKYKKIWSKEYSFIFIKKFK